MHCYCTETFVKMLKCDLKRTVNNSNSSKNWVEKKTIIEFVFGPPIINHVRIIGKLRCTKKHDITKKNQFKFGLIWFGLAHYIPFDSFRLLLATVPKYVPIPDKSGTKIIIISEWKELEEGDGNSNGELNHIQLAAFTFSIGMSAIIFSINSLSYFCTTNIERCLTKWIRVDQMGEDVIQKGLDDVNALMHLVMDYLLHTLYTNICWIY